MKVQVEGADRAIELEDFLKLNKEVLSRADVEELRELKVGGSVLIGFAMVKRVE